MESQQRGTPVIGANIGGIPELITDGVDGRLFTSRDSKQLAAIIKELWNNPTETDNYAKGMPEALREMSLKLTATSSSRFI